MYVAQNEKDDVAQRFVESLEKQIKIIFNTFVRYPEEKIITEEDTKKFEEATECHICGRTLGNDRVWDHCHITGKFRGAAHNKCYLNYRVPKFIDIIFHNLSRYDSHLFIKKLGGEIRCIANTVE